MSKSNTLVEQHVQTQKVELLDCGPASQVTKGFPLYFLFELSLPPFDRQLFM